MRNPAMATLRARMTGIGLRASWVLSAGRLDACAIESGPLVYEDIDVLQHLRDVVLTEARVVTANRPALIQDGKLRAVLDLPKNITDVKCLICKQMHG